MFKIEKKSGELFEYKYWTNYKTFNKNDWKKKKDIVLYQTSIKKQLCKYNRLNKFHNFN